MHFVIAGFLFGIGVWLAAKFLANIAAIFIACVAIITILSFLFLPNFFTGTAIFVAFTSIFLFLPFSFLKLLHRYICVLRGKRYRANDMIKTSIRHEAIWYIICGCVGGYLVRVEMVENNKNAINPDNQSSWVLILVLVFLPLLYALFSWLGRNILGVEVDTLKYCSFEAAQEQTVKNDTSVTGDDIKAPTTNTFGRNEPPVTRRSTQSDA